MAADGQPWKPGLATTNINSIVRNKQCDLALKLHAKDRLAERGLLMSDLLFVLKNGYVYEEPEESTLAGLYKYKIESQSPNSGARFLRAVVVPDGKSCQIKVITIMWRDEK
jgi:hypothetical protein